MAPAGWPSDLAPEGTERFEADVVSWLLDRGPADLRTSPLRHEPLALAYVVAQCVEAQVEAFRTAYRTVRADLGRTLSPDALTRVQQALEAQGALALAVQREVSLVVGALRRRVEAGDVA